jgi:aminoglycoside phosphotransferase (APT) family kinase protein
MVPDTWARALRVDPSDDLPAAPARTTAPPPSALSVELAAEAARHASSESVERVEMVESGFSNGTYRVQTVSGRAMAVQFATRDPASAGLHGSLLSQLAGHLPVPEVIALDADGELFGIPMLVTRWVEGTLLERALPSLSARDTQQLGAHAVEVLARMEEFTSAVPGFLAGPELHLVARRKPLADGVRDHVRDRVFRGESAVSLPLDVRHRLWSAIDHSADLLAAFEHERSLVHADLTPRNIIVRRGPAGWRISALLDWEFACFGSPLIDAGRLLRIRDPTGAFVSAVAQEFAHRHPDLPERWRLAAWLFDSVALSGPLARPREHAARAQARHEIEHALKILPTTGPKSPDER